MVKRKNTAIFLSNGSWVRTETKMPWTWDLPRSVQNAWHHSDLASWYPDKVNKVETAEKETYYTIEVSHDCGPEGSIPGDCVDRYKLYYRPDGALIKEDHYRP